MVIKPTPSPPLASRRALTTRNTPWPAADRLRELHTTIATRPDTHLHLQADALLITTCQTRGQGWTPRYMPGLNVKAATDREVVPGQDLNCALPHHLRYHVQHHAASHATGSCCMPRAAMPDSPTFVVLCDAVDLSSNATTYYVCSIRILAEADCYAEPVHGAWLDVSWRPVTTPRRSAVVHVRFG